jgi:hypothetical protein
MQSEAKLAEVKRPVVRGNAARLFDRQATTTFSYLALSLLIFGRGVLAHPASAYLGRGPDPHLYIWFQACWAYAISHHHDA